MRFLNYTGHISEDVLGRVMGPDRHGALYEAKEIVYSNDKSMVGFQVILANDTRSIQVDSFGEARVVE